MRRLLYLVPTLLIGLGYAWGYHDGRVDERRETPIWTRAETERRLYWLEVRMERAEERLVYWRGYKAFTEYRRERRAKAVEARVRAVAASYHGPEAREP